MTPEEARLNLDATTLRPQDTAEEARALAETDAELGAWVEGQKKFDAQVAGAMEDLPVPDALRERLLAFENQGAKKQVPKPHRRLDAWLATLATVAVLAVGAVALWNQQSDRNDLPDWQRQSLAMVREIDAGGIPLDHFSSDLGEIKGMLVKHGRPVPAGLPQGVEAMTSLGCKTFQVGAREATVVCFEILPGQEAHLVVMNNDKGSLPGAPPERRPEFVERDGWNVARWSDGGQCYFIATRAPRSALEKLFAVVFLR
jgi:hypothetical protein